MKYVYALLIIIFITISSCKENEPTAPEEETPQEVLAEATIGPEGGILETEDFKLTVPSGAFDQSSELKLYIEDKDSSNENSVTPLYVIEGMPENYMFPIEISVRYVGAVSGILYIERGAEIEVVYLDSTYSTTVFKLFSATDENGFLITNLSDGQSYGNYKLNKGVNGKGKTTIEGFFNGILASSDHFKIKSVDFPIDIWSSQYQIILNQFESFYDKYKDLGIEVSLTKWPKVITAKKEPISFGYGFPCEVDKNGNDLFIRNYPNLDMTEYYWFCERNLLSIILIKYKTSATQEWFYSGLADWFIHKYDHIWKNVYNHSYKKKIITQMNKGENNRYFISGLIEFLISKYGEGIMKDILNEIENNNLHPILSLTSNNRLPKHWLGDFHRSILIAELWLKRLQNPNPNYTMIDFCNENWSAEFGIEDTTTIIKWTETYKDLSAKLFRVNLLPGLNEEARLKFTVEGGDAEISLFKYKGSEIEFISNSEKADSISNIRDLADNGYQLIALVSNRMPNYPNFTNSDIELKIEQISEKPLPKVTACSIHLKNLEVNQILHYESGDVQSSGFITWHLNVIGESVKTFENNIFHQTYYYSENNDSTEYSGAMTVEFSANLDIVISFYAEEDYIHVDSDTVRNIKNELSFSGHDIPLIPSYDNNEFKVEGIETCNHIGENIAYSRVAVGVTSWNLADIKQCVEQTELYIEIEKE